MSSLKENKHKQAMKNSLVDETDRNSIGPNVPTFHSITTKFGCPRNRETKCCPYLDNPVISK